MQFMKYMQPPPLQNTWKDCMKIEKRNWNIPEVIFRMHILFGDMAHGLLRESQIVKLFDYLRESFSYVVVDMGTNVDKLNMAILENLQ